MDERSLNRIIEMAWEDRTPFEAIEFQFKLDEKGVIELMRSSLKPKSFRRWRARVQGRKTDFCHIEAQQCLWPCPAR